MRDSWTLAMPLETSSEDMVRLEDRALASRIAEGHADALAAAYDAHHQVARALARRILTNHASAEDLVHDAFVALPSAARGFEGRSSLRTFILSVVVCLFLILCGWPPVTNLLVQWANPAVVDAVASFSVMAHFNSISKGVLDTRDLLYFASAIVFCLFATSVVLRTHRG